MPVFASLPTSLGLLTLMSDESGLCALFFPGETVPAAPLAATRADLAADPLLAEAARQLLAYLGGSLHQFDLPLSIHGTDFQKQVWQQLRTIPYGQTRTYGDAATLGVSAR
jgi:methylated-DNA-[protein]-cysteine S-methyltransferase